MLRLPAIPVPTDDPRSYGACILIIKQAIEAIASGSVAQDDLQRLGLVTGVALASPTGKSTAVTQSDLVAYATRADLAAYATRADLANFVTHAELMATIAVLDGGTF